jgi:hypothetical protein
MLTDLFRCAIFRLQQTEWHDMPKFFSDHTPVDCDEFTRGYLNCAEWLARSARDIEGTGEFDREDRAECKGWTRDAIRRAKRDCRDFQRSNASLLEQYQETNGRDMLHAGHDFWLTRNRHGAGFWDRGNHPCLRALTDAAHAYGDCDAEFYRKRLHLR